MIEARRASLRAAALAVVVLVLAAVHLRRPPTFCVLRAVTGVPCPFCGGTTAAVDLGHGRIPAALGASPLALLMLFAWPLTGTVPAPAWWRHRHRRLRIGLVLGALALAEIWQLHRFGLIGG